MILNTKILITTLCVCATLSGVAQTIYLDEDSIISSITLKEVQIETRQKLPTLEIVKGDGSFRIGAETMSRTPQFLGITDPIRLMQSLPSVSSSDCISGGIYVHGCENSHNLVSIDGQEIFNPIHLLGLFSVFNTPHFESFDINPSPNTSILPNFVGAEISANTSWYHPNNFGMDVSIGMIESHATIRTPFYKNSSSLIFSGRTSYINALYGDAIKVENAPLKYGFSDFNFTYLQSLGKEWKLKMSAYYGNDKMNVKDPNYDSNIGMGWENLIANASFHKSYFQRHCIGYSKFTNNARIRYTDIDKKMPSDIYSLSYSGNYNIGIGNFGTGLTYRHSNPQQQDDINSDSLFSSSSLEARIGCSLQLKINNNFFVQPGCKINYYSTKDYSKLYILPSISLRYNIFDKLLVETHFKKNSQFIHKIEESTIGMPTDFWVLSDYNNKPLSSTDFALSLQGNSHNNILTYYFETYYRLFDNLNDWIGNLFSMINSDYQPLHDVVYGHGKAKGIACMLNLKLNQFQGWISYTLSKSQQRYPTINQNIWYPYSHDRTHDLKINLSYKLYHNLILSTTFIYATGRPYTEPLYAYMIGENLIFEFKEHNSSRLPAMHRLDLGINWNFYSKNGINQSLNFSVFNAYGHDNIMFKSYKYSSEQGILPTKWSMDYILPSINYNLKF